MISNIIMPKLGETMESGILIKWHKKEGDKIEKGDILFEIETDKAVFEHEAVKSGYLRKIVVPEGKDMVLVLIVVGYIADSMDEPIPDPEEDQGSAKKDQGMKKEIIKEDFKKEKAKKEDAPLKDDAKKISTAGGGRIFISPLARKMAFEASIDISSVKGTGPGGRIVARDIKSFTDSKDAVPAGEGTRVKELSKVNKIVAERLSLSKTTIPHYYLFQKINMTEAIKLRTQLKKKVKEKYFVDLTFTDIILKALSLSLQKYNDMNGTYIDGELRLSTSINIGMAVAWNDELYVPVINNTQDIPIGRIAEERTDLIESIIERKINPDNLSGGTFTLSNLGSTGLENFTAIINPPELGILAVGAIAREIIVLDNKISMADIMHVTLSCDHRVINGMYATKFLVHFKEILESPYTLLSGGF